MFIGYWLRTAATVRGCVRGAGTPLILYPHASGLSQLQKAPLHQPQHNSPRRQIRLPRGTCTYLQTIPPNYCISCKVLNYCIQSVRGTNVLSQMAKVKIR